MFPAKSMAKASIGRLIQREDAADGGLKLGDLAVLVVDGGGRESHHSPVRARGLDGDVAGTVDRRAGWCSRGARRRPRKACIAPGQRVLTQGHLLGSRGRPAAANRTVPGRSRDTPAGSGTLIQLRRPDGPVVEGVREDAAARVALVLMGPEVVRPRRHVREHVLDGGLSPGPSARSAIHRPPLFLASRSATAVGARLTLVRGISSASIAGRAGSRSRAIGVGPRSPSSRT